MELNLFEGIIANSKDPKFGSQEFIKTAYNAAAESITLLKNKNTILPLSKMKILVTGPTANSMVSQTEAGPILGKERKQMKLL
jgi:beta-glucosidase